MQTTIYMIRHGTTPANLENRFAGRSREDLHPDGIAQIRAVAGRLKGADVSRIFCAPLPRTVQSAMVLRESLDVPVVAAEALNEINIPHWDGFTKQEIRERYGDQYPTWLATPHLFDLPGCETLPQVRERAVQAVEGLLADHAGQSLVIVSHLIVLRCLALYYQGLEISDFRSIKIDNGSISSLIRKGKGETEFRQITSLVFS